MNVTVQLSWLDSDTFEC